MRIHQFLSVILILGLTAFPLSADPLTISNHDFLQLVNTVEMMTDIESSMNDDLRILNERVALLESELSHQRSATSKAVFKGVIVSVACSIAIVVPLAIAFGGNR